MARVDEALCNLCKTFIPTHLPDEDDETADERIDATIQTARSIVDAAASQPPASEINQATDLIKRKLLRENASPEKAAKFSNLYNRLLSLPVLNQKWAILYLLYQLSEPSQGTGLPHDALRSPLLESPQLDNIPRTEDLAQKRRPRPFETPRDSPVGDARDSRLSGTSIPARERQRRSRAEPAIQQAEETPPVQPEEPEKDYIIDPPESALLRDLPFNLQGLSSAHLEFEKSTSIKLPPSLPIPLISLLHTLAEPCLLYCGLDDFSNGSDGGLITQSLRAAISNELRSYLSLVSTLEGEIRRSMTALEKDDTPMAVRKAGVTLKRCVAWTRDATMGLRLMSLIVEESKAKKGGQIISLIHGFSSSHGDPFVGAFAERLLVHVTRPFYDMLQRWVYDGELTDPYQEFFVTEPDPSRQPDIDPRRVATSVWEAKYQLDPEMVPSIITTEFSKKIFLIGKSLNFIRHNCTDSDWANQYSRTHTQSLSYNSPTTTLETSITTAYKLTMSRLTHLMSTKYDLFTHLAALKKYLLLSQGDFIALLMESLSSNLDRPANSQYRHTLTSQLEHAIKHSNAQYDNPDVLRRLDARMLELSSGEIGWDCFTLEYKVSPPCDVVITQWASTQYLKIFNLLWRIKRVEFSLSSIFRRCTTGSRGVLSDSSIQGLVGRDFHHARSTIHEMIHFISQLQYYILFEVVESAWSAFQDRINSPDCTLDDLIDAHTKYITSITHKGLLGSQRHATTGAREDSFLAQLHYILKDMLSYKDAVESLYSFSVAEFTRRQDFALTIEKRTAAGKWGITEKDLLPAHLRSGSSSPSSSLNTPGGFQQPLANGGATPSPLNASTNDPTLLTTLRHNLTTLRSSFRSRLLMFLYDLAHQPDVDMRFLGVVMNFNDVYRPVNVRRKEREREKAREKEKERLRTTEGKGGKATMLAA
ncbi:putative spindle pole body component [Phaeomoniella chlamydospora]|uniref:Putative spindle pole body component n=1 Tax=Phaeomoniella chlamydospora TaxID=158046 RepID=A0A0G2F4J4_PHACM|nr:putative spindle pole body component [Phaeomoniella chlamydospora]